MADQQQRKDVDRVRERFLVVVGQNLLNREHREFVTRTRPLPAASIERGAYGKLVWTFQVASTDPDRPGRGRFWRRQDALPICGHSAHRVAATWVTLSPSVK